MHIQLLDRYLDSYFAATTSRERLHFVQLAREAQQSKTEKLTAVQQADATLVRLLRETPMRQMTCKKLAALASVKSKAVSDAVRRGVLITYDDRVVRWARLPSVDYSGLDM